MIKPMVHLNGTSRRELQEQLEAAGIALNEAIDQVSYAAPNGRDYYPLGPGAFQTATVQHLDRVQRLRSVRDELLAIYESLFE